MNFQLYGKKGEEIILIYYSQHCSKNPSKICYKKHELIREYFVTIMSD